MTSTDAKKQFLLKLLAGSWDEYATTWSKAFHAKDVYYFTGAPCKHGHIAPRAIAGHECIACRLNAL